LLVLKIQYQNLVLVLVKGKSQKSKGKWQMAKIHDARVKSQESRLTEIKYWRGKCKCKCKCKCNSLKSLTKLVALESKIEKCNWLIDWRVCKRQEYCIVLVLVLVLVLVFKHWGYTKEGQKS
jgi:hypothetical protein